MSTIDTRQSISARVSRQTNNWSSRPMKSAQAKLKTAVEASTPLQRPETLTSSRTTRADTLTPSRTSRPATLTPSRTTRPGQNSAPRKRKSRKREEVTPPPTPPPETASVWDQFSTHVKEIQGTTDLELGMKKESYSNRCSEVHNRIVNDLKAQDMKRRARELMLKMKGITGILKVGEPVSPPPGPDSESDSEDEEAQAEWGRQAGIARQHWLIIRRYVQDRIARRKQKSKLGGAWNKLRAQSRATTRPEVVRRELFEKYGVIPPPGKRYPQDQMKPVFSNKAKEIIAKFELIQVVSLYERAKSAAAGHSKYDVITSRHRPRDYSSRYRPTTVR